MRSIPLALGFLLAAGAAEARVGGPPAPGVYACYGQRGPAIPMQFGLIDRTTYATYDGVTGRYTFKGDQLVMTTGPLAGVKYVRVPDPKRDGFRMLDAKGQVTQYTCPWQPGNARKGHW